MFSSNSLFPRVFTRSAFAFVLFCLVAVLSFMSCQTEPDDNFIDDHKLNAGLIGTWADTTFFDGYTITADSLEYDNGMGGGYTGSIEYVSNFSNNAGVIIIKYNADAKASYPIYDDDWVTIIDYVDLPGDYLGVYYRNLKPGFSMELSGAINPDYSPAEKEKMYEAVLAFTQANGDGYYVSFWGGPYLNQ